MNITQKNLIINLLNSNKKTIKYNPYIDIDCPVKFMLDVVSVLKFDKLFNVILEEFSDYMKLKEIRLGTGTKQMLFMSFSFNHKYYPTFNVIDFILTVDYFQVTYRTDGECDRHRTNYMIYPFGKTGKSKYYISEQDELKMWNTVLDYFVKDLI